MIVTVNEIKQKIQFLYQTHPLIHISVTMNRPRVRIEDQEARITAIYPNVFKIETRGKEYTAQYVDVLTGNLKIAELDQIVRI